MRLIASAMLALASFAGQQAVAAPPAQPLPRDGSFPGGFYASGNYCVSSK